MKHTYLALALAVAVSAACTKEKPHDPGLETEPEEIIIEEEEEEEVERVREGEIPKIYLSTSSSISSKDYYVSGTIRFTDPDGWYSDLKDTTLNMQIRGRGNTSWGKPKKPYRVKLDGRLKAFGMKANLDWDLLANYCDKSLLRNKLGMKVSKIVGMEWTPKHRTCEVYLNNSYLGCYDLFQHKEVAKEKVDINLITPADAPDAGDYYIEIESSGNDFRTSNTGGSSNFRIPIIFKDPEASELTAAQQDYIKNWLLEMERSFGRKDYTEQTGYRKYLDMTSFAKFYIVEEIAKNIDGNLRKSTFMTKCAGQPLVLYHIWDFDIAFGNCNYMHTEFSPLSSGIRGENPEQFFVKNVDEQKSGNGLMQNLFKDPNFVAEVKRIWQEAYPELAELPEFLRSEAAVYDAAYRKDFNKWSNPKSDNWPEPTPYASTYDAALNKLVDFYQKRIAWLNTNILAL